MDAHKLQDELFDYLQTRGSIDVQKISRNDIALKYGLDARAEAAIDCADLPLDDLYRFDHRFQDLAVGNENCFALPYSQRLLLIFEAP